MKVIVAGFPKTGTKSMQAALLELGYSVYDFMESYVYLRDDWEKICLEGGSTADFKRMYENVDAVTDVPSCFFWDEIHKAFPDAKIILTMRDSEEIWSESYESQWKTAAKQPVVMLKFLSPTLMRIWKYSILIGNTIFGTTGKLSFFGRPHMNMTLCRMAYRRHNSHVLRTAPKDKLLLYNVKEGWEPLCKFLDVEVPDKPFPHSNIRASYVKDLVAETAIGRRGKREIIASLSLLSVLFGFGIYKFVKCSNII